MYERQEADVKRADVRLTGETEAEADAGVKEVYVKQADVKGMHEGDRSKGNRWAAGVSDDEREAGAIKADVKGCKCEVSRCKGWQL